MFTYTSDLAENLIAKTIEIPDQVIPSSNSVMAKNLYHLGIFFDYPVYIDKSIRMLQKISDQIIHGGPYFANWGTLLGLCVTKPFQIATMGEQALDKNMQMQRSYLPTSLFTGGMEENLPLLYGKIKQGKTNIYVCQGMTCFLPVVDVQKAWSLIERSLR